MIKRLVFFWEEVKSSFWFIPILIILLSICAAIGLIYLDQQIDYQPSGLIQFIFTESADSARIILSTISSAMIGVAGTVFSITLVALSLASGQFGPRILRNFMTERINQIVLGSYVSTYLYSLLILNAIKDVNDTQFVPQFSVFISILAAVANIILLIIFIHNIAVSIQADNIISDISKSLSQNIRALFPEELGEELPGKELLNLDSLKKSYRYKKAITSPKTGYMQDIDVDFIFNMAKENDQLIFLNERPGNYLVKDAVIGEIYSNEIINEKASKNLRQTFIIGKVRTPQKDAEFSIHQMVEIASRALSPGINDPYTAIACIDNLTSTMCSLTKVRFPSSYRFDEKEELRIVADTLTFEGMLDAAFNQIRQFATSSPAVIIRLMEALITINKFAKFGEHKNAVHRHAEMVLNAARLTFNESNDLKDLEERSKFIITKDN